MKQPIVLAVAGGWKDKPDWLTQDYFEKCMADQKLQNDWEPKVEDWYFCRDLYAIMQIKSLSEYFSEGQVPPLKSDYGKDSRGKWECDVYIPEPSGDVEVKPAQGKTAISTLK